ncbi:MAG: hypothetical protein FWC62_03745 [Firmicutes bacterium]|nr:hypothetical protein [Bacillota bacterium]
MPKKKKRADFYDDGRTVVNMNVEGMPWYHKPAEPKSEQHDPDGPEPLTKEERRAIAWGATKAVLVIIALFVVVLLGIILFTQHVWLR